MRTWTALALGPQHPPIYPCYPLMCYVPFLCDVVKEAILVARIKLEDKNLLPSSPTHRSKRHERGQREIKCACEKSTHRTSPEPPLAYWTHSSDGTNTHLHTQAHTFNAAERLKGKPRWSRVWENRQRIDRSPAAPNPDRKKQAGEMMTRDAASQTSCNLCPIIWP